MKFLLLISIVNIILFFADQYRCKLIKAKHNLDFSDYKSNAFENIKAIILFVVPITNVLGLIVLLLVLLAPEDLIIEAMNKVYNEFKRN